ncbi:MAG: lysophospholipid acyltransferase family protein [Myxococcota bacterium]
MARFRSFLGMLATAGWCSFALMLRPVWRRSVIVLQPYWARTVIWCAGVKVNVESRAPVRPPVIYVANHQSGLDILVMIAWMPDSVRFVAKKQMASAPFTGWCMRAADYVFIDRSNPDAAKESLREAAADIKRGGRSVIIFPEGTRYPPGFLGPFKSGAIHMAAAAGVPLVPVGLTRTGELMERRSLVSKAGLVHIRIGEPVDPREWVGREKELKELLRAKVRELAGESAAQDADEALELQAERGRLPSTGT